MSRETSAVLDVDTLELSEALGTFQVNTLVKNDKKKQIAKTQLDLKTGQDIHKTSIFRNLFTRENIIYFGKMIYETPVRIDQCNGKLRINLIDQEQISRQLFQIPEKHRRKIGYIHLSTIQILLKSTFQEGIDSPIRMAILDERMTDLNNQILGIMNGNLAYGKIKFNTRLKLGIPLISQELDQTITIAYKFYKENLMLEGQYPFSITYQISYALTNSHHSIEFKETEQIYLDQLFTEVAKVGTKFHQKLTPLPAIQYPIIQSPITRRHSFSSTSTIPSLPRTNSFSIPRSLQEPIRITQPSNEYNQRQLETITSQLSTLTQYLQDKL